MERISTGIANGGLNSTQKFRLMASSQAVKAPGFDPGREGTLFTLVRIQPCQFWTRQVLQNGRPLVDGYTPINNLITEDEKIMKQEELKEWGLTDEQVKSVMEQYGKDVTKLQKENEKLTADRNTWKEKAETAEETLKGFEGIDPAQVQTELATWKKKAEDAEENAKKQLYERDFADALKSELENVKFTSEAAKKAVMADIKEAGLKLKDGKILGLNDLINQMKEKDASAFVDEAQEQAQQNAASFTTSRGPQTPPGTMTRKDIEGIKDATERQAAIAQNLHLFGKNE